MAEPKALGPLLVMSEQHWSSCVEQIDSEAEQALLEELTAQRARVAELQTIVRDYARPVKMTVRIDERGDWWRCDVCRHEWRDKPTSYTHPANGCLWHEAQQAGGSQ